MKKIILTLTALALSLNAFADMKSEELLRVLQKKVAALGDYRVAFTVTIDGRSVKGTYEVSGDSFHIITDDTEVFSDGKTKYEVNKLDKEIQIDEVDPNDRTILGNPTRMFDFLDGSYTHRFMSKATLKDGEADKLELTGTLKGDKMSVYLNTKTGMPSRISYYMGNLNTDAVVDIENITPGAAIDHGGFVFDPARYAGFEFIDFR